MAGGYCDCACRDCFDIAITSTKRLALCNECSAAGCDRSGESECCRPPEDEDAMIEREIKEDIELNSDDGGL